MTRPRKSILNLKAYIHGKNSSYVYEKSTRVMKLDSNESSLPPSPRVTASLIEFIQKAPLQWYPDLQAKNLMERLAEYTKCPPEFIRVFNGSDSALETICKTYLEPGDEAILCMPTYDHFRVFAESCDARVIPVYGESPFKSKVSKLLSALTPKSKIIYISNPNNPTGLLHREGEIKFLLEHATQVILVVDEAYFEFCGTTMTSFLGSHKNLIISRSFSKAFALAGLRCGYILTDPSNLEHLDKMRNGKINSLTQVAAAAALEDLEYLERCVFEVKQAKKWLYDKLKETGVAVIDTHANFLLLEVPDPQRVEDFLEKNDIFVRSYLPSFKGFLRITVGHQLLMERFWKVFKKIPSSYLFTKNALSTIQTSKG